MDRISVKIPGNMIRDYEKKVIIHESPGFLLPMSFVETGEIYNVTYDSMGFTAVGDIDECLTVKDVFDIIEEIISVFMTSYLYLIFPERFTLNKDTVYFNMEERKVRILFMPPDKRIVPSEELDRFIKEIQSMHITSEAVEYAALFRKYIRSGAGLKELRQRAGLIKREAFLGGLR